MFGRRDQGALSMAGAGSDGYRIQASGMEDEAGKLDQAGDDVGLIRKAVEDGMCYAQDALGGSDSGPAYDNFATAWQAEAKTLEAALHELADKVGVSQRNYRNADQETIVALHSAGGGNGLTTMPAPAAAHPGITTGPAPGVRPAVLGEPPIGTRPTPGAPPPSLADFD
ncbi:WXG100 family type VII secretion target [Streptomyces sp. SCSIO 30461]|uniref:WXG100 family type VII secretion target n=1 Tax=Streptomyces sp. SCSIO 30461 TaxID=3118085 RepID=UPI0030CB8888